MSTQTPERANIDRAARHARQGVQSAARMFGEIRVSTATDEEAQTAIDAAIARVDAGPAPQAFKDAMRGEFARLSDRPVADPSTVAA